MSELREVDDLDAILDDHDRWLETGGNEGDKANLRWADLRKADLRWADLRWADLRKADLRKANLREADLRWANLRWADLSQSRGLVSAREWMEDHFEAASDGYIAYKVFGYHQDPPEAWAIEEGAVIEEVVNPCRTIDCACGVNVGTREWVASNVHGEVWKVLIRWKWLPDVVVPYSTDGKVRCGKAELLEVVSNE